jgi:hypothetical protein
MRELDSSRIHADKIDRPHRHLLHVGETDRQERKTGNDYNVGRVRSGQKASHPARWHNMRFDSEEVLRLWGF